VNHQLVGLVAASKSPSVSSFARFVLCPLDEAPCHTVTDVAYCPATPNASTIKLAFRLSEHLRNCMWQIVTRSIQVNYFTGRVYIRRLYPGIKSICPSYHRLPQQGSNSSSFSLVQMLNTKFPRPDLGDVLDFQLHWNLCSCSEFWWYMYDQ
jgi:hypothetical protein